MKKLTKIEPISSKLAAIVFLCIIAYLPFHIFISTVIGVKVGGLEFMKAFKDIILCINAILLGPYLINNTTKVKLILFSRVGMLCLLFLALNIVYLVLSHGDLDSTILGFVYNTRYIGAFFVGAILSQAQPRYINPRNVIKIIVGSSIAVSFIGILQFFVLPKDFFARLGYSMQSGALPWFYIDDKPDFPRIMSTMRDPNTLGSYLLIPIAILVSKISVDHKYMTNSTKLWCVSLVGFIALALLLAFSRGAILGLIVTLAVAIIIPGIGFIRNNLRRVASIVVLVCVVVTGIFILSINLHPRTFKNVVLHADEQTTLRDPNELRIDFVKRSLNRIYHNPQGTGLGTAGLASMKNEQSGVYLTENYYLQLAIEIGLVGLIVFTTLIVVVVAKLYFVWRGYGKYYSLAMLSSFTGLFVTNVLAHIWTNETIAVIWWGTAGVVLWQPIHTGVKMYKKTQNNVV